MFTSKSTAGTLLRSAVIGAASAAAAIGLCLPASAAPAGAPQATLWGVYGDHDMHDCPLNNRETAKRVIDISKADLGPLLAKYGIEKVHAQYHSGLEHTFLWVFETDRPHDLEEFTQELGVASWNDLKIVPIRRFGEDVVPEVKRLHGLN